MKSERRLTILHTIETAGPGGAETMFLNLASSLDSSRFRSLALLPEGHWLPGQLRGKGIPTITIPPGHGRWFEPMRTMLRLVRAEKVDLVHSHLPDQNFYSCLVGRITGCKTVVTYHGAPRPRETEGWKGGLKLRVIRRWATAVVVVSEYLREAVKKLGFSDDRVVRIYNGIDPSRFVSTAKSPFRNTLALGEDSKLVGMVANLRESKGYEFFVQAARKVADRFPQARFLAIGEIDPPILSRISALVREVQLEDRFQFLGFRNDVAEILQALDVFVLSSVSEGFSLATIEAMAAGRAVVVTSSGGPQEIVENGRTGILVPPADAEALAAKICAVLDNPEWAATLGRAAQEQVQRQFSISQIVREYEALYERCLSSN
jgi:glycosyltransferase involved in cell wall biosynthesis